MTFNFFPVPSAVLSVEQVSPYPQSSHQSVCYTGYFRSAQLRFTMKSYSFIRENAYKVLHPWNKDDDSGNPLWLCLTQS